MILRRYFWSESLAARLGHNPFLFLFWALSQQNQLRVSRWDLVKPNTNVHTDMPMAHHKLGVSGYTIHVLHALMSATEEPALPSRALM